MNQLFSLNDNVVPQTKKIEIYDNRYLIIEFLGRSTPGGYDTYLALDQDHIT